MSNHDHSDHHFIVPARYYVATLLSLLVLTIITVVVAQYNFGGWNLPIALLVAVIKAGLVINIFMGLRWNRTFDRIAFLGSLVFLFIFFLFSFSDELLRPYRNPIEAVHHDIKSPVKPLVKGAEHHE
ncbi:hypothetical protein EB093_01765 [bacterium]|nr:hypothetical protein [bacterium]